MTSYSADIWHGWHFLFLSSADKCRKQDLFDTAKNTDANANPSSIIISSWLCLLIEIIFIYMRAWKQKKSQRFTPNRIDILTFPFLLSSVLLSFQNRFE